MAQEAGLDLVEIQPDSRPPLCKIMDYGKYKYELSKKKGGGKQKSQEIKEVRLGRSAKIDPHDVEIRVNQARRFLMAGHKVQFVQRFRGREMAFQDIGMDRLHDIVDLLADIAKLEAPPRTMGRQMSMTVAPDKPKVEAIKRKLAEEAAARGEEYVEETIDDIEPLDDDFDDDHDDIEAEDQESAEASDSSDDIDESKLSSKERNKLRAKRAKEAKKNAGKDEDPTLLAETPADLLD